MRVLNMLTRILISLSCMVVALPSQALDEAEVSKNMRTNAHLYLTAQEASEFMEANGSDSLFIDVRDPAEVHTIGMPSSADANVPFMHLDTSKWDERFQRFGMNPNPEFSAAIDQKLKGKSLNKESNIILMCGSGGRSARAVNALYELGYRNVYSVVGGFTDWQEQDLDIDRRLDKTKMWGNPE